LKVVCFNFNNRAQSLSEFATFGSILLLALSFFLAYASRYTVLQNGQMTAFRLAMNQAFLTNRPDASGSVSMVSGLPKPQDTLGLGNTESNEFRSQVVWGNTLGKSYLEPGVGMPRIAYYGLKADGSSVEYTTKGGFGITTDEPIRAKLSGSTELQIIPWSKLRCYQADPSNPASPRQAMYIIGDDTPDDSDNTSQLIETVYLSQGTLGLRYVPYEIIGVWPPGASQGDAIIGLDLLSSAEGQINPNYLTLGADTGDYADSVATTEFVNAGTLQGYLHADDQVIKRESTLRLEETPGAAGYWKSTKTDSLLSGSQTTRKMRKNGRPPYPGPGLPWPDPTIETYPISNPESITKIWQTPK